MRGNNCYCSVVESIGLKTLAEVFVHQCINPLSAELLVDGKLKCGSNVGLRVGQHIVPKYISCIAHVWLCYNTCNHNYLSKFLNLIGHQQP